MKQSHTMVVWWLFALLAWLALPARAAWLDVEPLPNRAWLLVSQDRPSELRFETLDGRAQVQDEFKMSAGAKRLRLLDLRYSPVAGESLAILNTQPSAPPESRVRFLESSEVPERDEGRLWVGQDSKTPVLAVFRAGEKLSVEAFQPSAQRRQRSFGVDGSLVIRVTGLERLWDVVRGPEGEIFLLLGLRVNGLEVLALHEISASGKSERQIMTRLRARHTPELRQAFYRPMQGWIDLMEKTGPHRQRLRLVAYDVKSESLVPRRILRLGQTGFGDEAVPLRIKTLPGDRLLVAGQMKSMPGDLNLFTYSVKGALQEMFVLFGRCEAKLGL